MMASVGKIADDDSNTVRQAENCESLNFKPFRLTSLTTRLKNTLSDNSTPSATTHTFQSLMEHAIAVQSLCFSMFDYER